MKKVLLATTVLAAVSVATPVLAQEVSVTGFYRFGWTSFSDDAAFIEGATGDPVEDSATATRTDSEININFSNTTDSGLTYAATFELEGDAAGVDESSLSLSGDFGTVILGNNDYAHDSFITWAPTHFGTLTSDSAQGVPVRFATRGTATPLGGAAADVNDSINTALDPNSSSNAVANAANLALNDVNNLDVEADNLAAAAAADLVAANTPATVAADTAAKALVVITADADAKANTARASINVANASRAVADQDGATAAQIAQATADETKAATDLATAATSALLASAAALAGGHSDAFDRNTTNVEAPFYAGNANYGDNTKITYMSPNLSGFQFGVSVTDDAGGNADISLGASFTGGSAMMGDDMMDDGMMGGMSYTLTANSFDNGEDGADADSSTAFGGTLGLGDLTLTAATSEREEGIVDTSALQFGVGYDVSDSLSIGASWVDGESESHDQELEVVSFSLQYTIAPGLAATAALNDYSVTDTTVVGAPRTNDTTSMVFSIRADF